MRGHRREMLVRRHGIQSFALASWDDNYDLHVTVEALRFRVYQQGDSDVTVGEILRDMAGAGLEVECCAHCAYFVYAGMAADTGSTMSSCSEGKTERQFRRADDTLMTDWCEAFRRRQTR